MTWDERAYPKKCVAQAKKRNANKARSHYITVDHMTEGFYSEFTHGEIGMDLNLVAGTEYVVHMDMHWQDPEVGKDFSVVAQGLSGGGLTITHSTGMKSAVLPVIENKNVPKKVATVTVPATPAATTGGTTPAATTGGTTPAATTGGTTPAATTGGTTPAATTTGGTTPAAPAVATSTTECWNVDAKG